MPSVFRSPWKPADGVRFPQGCCLRWLWAEPSSVGAGNPAWSWGRTSALGCSPQSANFEQEIMLGALTMRNGFPWFLALCSILSLHTIVIYLYPMKGVGGMRIIWTIEVNLYWVNYPVIFKNCLFDYVSVRGVFKTVGAAARLHTHGNQGAAFGTGSKRALTSPHPLLRVWGRLFWTLLHG